MRKIKFVNEKYYHIFNRGVDKRETFLDDSDYFRFLKSLKDFNDDEPIGSLYEKHIRDNGSSTPKRGVELPKKDLVEIICYCLNPNHFHLILRQECEDGISNFMHKIGTGYTNYFNKKCNRTGSLFQGRYKAIHIDSNEYLLYLSAYVNKNHFIHGYGDEDWRYSSLLDYLGKRNGKLCSKNIILNQFDSIKDYEEFLNKNALFLKEKKEFQKYLLE